MLVSNAKLHRPVHKKTFLYFSAKLVLIQLCGCRYWLKSIPRRIPGKRKHILHLDTNHPESRLWSIGGKQGHIFQVMIGIIQPLYNFMNSDNLESQLTCNDEKTYLLYVLTWYFSSLPTWTWRCTRTCWDSLTLSR